MVALNYCSIDNAFSYNTLPVMTLKYRIQTMLSSYSTVNSGDLEIL